MSNATFIGIDLAWKPDHHPTGVAVLTGDRCRVQLTTVKSALSSVETVAEFVRIHTGDETVVAIDAPLVIANVSGQRRCETLVGNRYGSRHASCHTTNLQRYPDAASVRLAMVLAANGYVHAASTSVDDARRVMAEVYPHAAMVALFDLPTVIKYKKGTMSQRRAGLSTFRQCLGCLAEAEPACEMAAGDFFAVDLSNLAGRDLKRYEDGLDAIFCAYLAYYFWYWRTARNEVFGDIENGYLLNPRMVVGGIGHKGTISDRGSSKSQRNG